MSVEYRSLPTLDPHLRDKLCTYYQKVIRKDTEEIFTITEKWKYEAHNDSITDVKFVKDDGAVFIISTSIGISYQNFKLLKAVFL